MQLQHVVPVAAARTVRAFDLRNQGREWRVTKPGEVAFRRDVTHRSTGTFSHGQRQGDPVIAILFAMIEMLEDVVVYQERLAK